MSVSVLKATVGSLLFVCAAIDAVWSAIARSVDYVAQPAVVVRNHSFLRRLPTNSTNPLRRNSQKVRASSRTSSGFRRTSSNGCSVCRLNYERGIGRSTPQKIAAPDRPR